MGLTIFTAYSHRDEAIRDALAKHLSPLRREGLVDVWHDRRIPAGAAVDNTISQALEAADVVLLLISSDFMASDYCWNVEAARALTKHAQGETTVIPVIVRYCDWHNAPFAYLRATPTDGLPIMGGWQDPDFAMLTVAKDIRAVVEEIVAARQTGSTETEAYSFTSVFGTEDYSPNGLTAIRINHVARYKAGWPNSILLFVNDYAFRGMSFLVTAAVADATGGFAPNVAVRLEATGGWFGYPHEGTTGPQAGGVFSTKIYPNDDAEHVIVVAHSPEYGSVRQTVRIVQPPVFGPHLDVV